MSAQKNHKIHFRMQEYAKAYMEHASPSNRWAGKICCSLKQMKSSYLEKMPRDEAPITSLLILHLATSPAIAFTTSSDSICRTSTCTCKLINIWSQPLQTCALWQFSNEPNLSLSTHLFVKSKFFISLPLHFLYVSSNYIISHFWYGNEISHCYQ